MDFGAKELLLGSGSAFLIGMLVAYRKRATVPFKVCYGMAWPTLGGGIMLAVQPEPKEFSKKLEAAGLLDPEDVQKRKQANTAAVESMKRFTASK